MRRALGAWVRKAQPTGGGLRERARDVLGHEAVVSLGEASAGQGSSQVLVGGPALPARGLRWPFGGFPGR